MRIVSLPTINCCTLSCMTVIISRGHIDIDGCVVPVSYTHLKVNRSGQEEPSLLQAEMEEELDEEVQIHDTTKEVIGKQTMGVETSLLLVPELMEEPGENVTEDDVTEEVVDENQSDLDQLMAYRSSVHDAMGVILCRN